MFKLFLRGNKSSFARLSIEDYQGQFIKSKTSHTLIDVRTAQEFKQGHIGGAVNIPLDKLRSRLEDIASDKPVILVCASGSRSASAARMIANAGRSDVHNLLGGTSGWAAKGNPLKR